MPDEIWDYLYHKGPTLSSEIVKHLVSTGIGEEAARKRVSRVEPPIQRLNNIILPNREAFLLLDEHFGTAIFWINLSEALVQTRSAYGRALLGLAAREGAVSYPEFPIASGLPVANAKGHLLHSLVEKRLLELRLINKIGTADGDEVSDYLREGLTARRKATVLVEDIVLSVFRAWLVKIGWSSANAVKIRSADSL